MKSLRIQERLGILRDHFYSHVVFRDQLDKIDGKLLLLLDNKLDIRQLNPATGRLRLKQEICFQILRILKRIASNNEICFWLDFGTLLGAFRHGGFIPWDDDLDISLLRKDYEAFSSVLENQLPPQLFFSRKTVPDGTEIGIGRVYEKDTGFYVDIYPYEEVPGALNSNGKKTKWESAYADLFKTVSSYGFVHGLSGKTERIMSDWWRDNSTGDGDETGIAVSTDYYLAPPIYRNVFYREDIFPIEEISFEGERFGAPARIETILLKIYDDYMKFPRDAGLPAHAHSTKSIAPELMRKTIDNLNEIVRKMDRT